MSPQTAALSGGIRRHDVSSVVVPGFVVHFTAVRAKTVLESTMSGAYDMSTSSMPTIRAGSVSAC